MSRQGGRRERMISPDPPSPGLPGELNVPVMNVSKFERFFRVAGGLDVDKTDLKRCSDFVHRKAYDLLLMSQAAAKFNLRDVIEFWDLPITKGLQESIHGFTKLDEQIELEPILEGRTQLLPLDLEYGEETRLRLPSVYGGPSVALARGFKIVDPHLKNPQMQHRETTFRLFDLLL
jgi:hypothetical protein